MTPNIGMKRTLTAAVLAILAASAGLSGALAAADEALAPALKAVQGVWVSGQDAQLNARWTIEKDKVTATVDGTDYIGKLKLDKDAKPHASWTITITEGPGDAQGKVAKGIYKLDGDKLVVNISVPGGDRPTDFDPADQEVYLFELQKEKKD